MALVSETPLLLVDAVVQSAGVLLLGAWLLGVARGAVHPSLSQLDVVDPPRAALIDAGMALLIYFLTLAVFQGLAGLQPERGAGPGSQAWRIAHAADLVAKAIASAFLLTRLHAPSAWLRRAIAAVRRTPLALGLALVAFPICFVQLYAAKSLWRWLDPDAAPALHGVLEALRQGQLSGGEITLLAVAAVGMAPLAEELLFRGALLDGLRARLGKPWTAVAFSSIAFGLIHAQPQDVIPLMTLGAMLAYLRLRTGSVGVCVIAHVIFNARTMAYAVLNPDLVGNEW